MINYSLYLKLSIAVDGLWIKGRNIQVYKNDQSSRYFIYIETVCPKEYI